MVGEARLTYREVAAPRDIEHVVSCLWLQRPRDGATPRRQLSVPNAAAEIVCHRASGRSWLVGPRTTFRYAAEPADGVFVGIRFRPGVSPELLGANTSETLDRALLLEDCWGAAGKRLGERVARAGSTHAAPELLAAGVRARMGPEGREDRFGREVLELLQPWNARTVAAASRGLFFSDRQLRRRCHARFGFAPKTLQRLLRFQGLLAVVHGGSEELPPLARLAAQLGYADQAHLTRECRTLTGFAPRALQRELAASCGAVHDHSVSFGPLRKRILGDG